VNLLSFNRLNLPVQRFLGGVDTAFRDEPNGRLWYKELHQKNRYERVEGIEIGDYIPSYVSTLQIT